MQQRCSTLLSLCRHRWCVFLGPHDVTGAAFAAEQPELGVPYTYMATHTFDRVVTCCVVRSHESPSP
eukprot:5296413-Amphidinium_carterae.3